MTKKKVNKHNILKKYTSQWFWAKEKMIPDLNFWLISEIEIKLKSSHHEYSFSKAIC